MSIEAYKWALDLDHGNPTHKAVLLGMANHADPTGTNCFPSIDRIARYTALHERTVRRAINEMVEIGLLEKQQNPGKTCRYSLALGVVKVDEQLRLFVDEPRAQHPGGHSTRSGTAPGNPGHSTR